MTVVRFTKIAAGPAYGPYDIGDVVDINATDLSRMTGSTGPSGSNGPAAVQLASSDPDFNKRTKKGT